MEKLEYFKALSELFELNGLPCPSDELCDKLYMLSELLLSANKIHNLTAIKEEEDVIVKHFVDSLFLSGALPEGSRVIDVGCGPGFPSLPISIYRPDVTLLGVDSTAKKINYVNETARALGLDNISAISARAEELGHDFAYRESFDIATARAVASLPVLTELCLPFVKVGGYFVAMKAQSAAEELELARTAITKCGGEFVRIEELTLKHRKPRAADESRNLIIIKKVKPTPDIYPRIYSKITKKPL